MKIQPLITHLLRHAWFWPIEFWLRPLTVMDRYKKSEWFELSASLIGSGLWGTLMGILLWLNNDDIHSIWITAGAFAVAGAVAATAAVAVAAAVAAAAAGTVAGAAAGAAVGAVAVAVAVAGTGAVVGAGAGAGAGTGAGAGAVILSIFVIGILLGSWLSLLGSWLSLTMVALILFIGIIQPESKKYPNLLAITWLVGLSIVGFAFFPLTPINQIPLWGIVLAFSFGIGILAGFYRDFDDGLWKIKQTCSLKLKKASQPIFLSIFYGLFLIIALGLWIASFIVSEDFAQKLKILATFLAIAPIVGTGLLFYPLMPFITFWQYRSVKSFTLEKFQLTAPFRWQTFAYPLPHLRSYLFKLAQQQDIKTAFDAIQQLQLWTLQMSAARKAAQDLASDPDTAINFCGEIALRTNNATLLPLATTGKIGRAIAILTKPEKEEKKQPITLWINDYPPKASQTFKMLLAREQPTFPKWFTDFQTIREAGLAQKLEYALNQLKSCQDYQAVSALQHLLETLQSYIEVTQLNDMLTIVEQPLSIPKHYPQWMQGGWFVLQNFTRELADFPKYRPLESAEARRQYLTKQQQKLNALNWKKIPHYWATIGQELVEHWVDCLEQGKKQARNFLHLEIDLPQNSLLPGQQQLNLRVFNRSSILGEELVVEMRQTTNWHWINRQAEYQLLEGKTSIDLHFDCHINKPGPYLIRGELKAQDLDGHRFHQPFDFQIIVAEAGHIYKEPPHQLYIVGECINSDHNFFGRTDLLAWLGSLWRIPDGKSTVVLIGQRRIGKSSLLHKIQRSELDNTQLLPVYIDGQGIGDKSAYSFLATVSNAMSKKLGINQTTLSQETPYLDFKNFLETLKILLEQRRFLIMIDESEPIFHEKFGPELPNFLRSLMQQPEYPTVLLFCGTYFLKQVASDYSSVFFNTAHFKTLSYLSKEESADLLQTTAQDFLEFGPDVLEQAYALTNGQPYLLQNLGAKLIETFNTELRKGKERSNYVNFKDLQTITERLVKEEDNAAFRDHWKGSNSATHRVLSALAWATQNMSRPQLDINGILAALQENQLDVSRKQTYEIIQNLRGEEILEKKGQVYRFVVPLYRQWIAYWYEPDLVREEGLED